MKKIAILLATAFTLSGCLQAQPPQAPSESRPGVSSMNQAQRTDMCQVVSVRTVQLTQPYTGGNTRSRYGNRQAQGPQETNGQLIGAIGGALLGNALNDRNGAAVGALLGGLGGQYVGSQRDATAPYAFGQEIIVRSVSGRSQGQLQTVVQGNSPESRALRQGQGCYIVGSGRDVRIVGI